VGPLKIYGVEYDAMMLNSPRDVHPEPGFRSNSISDPDGIETDPVQSALSPEESKLALANSVEPDNTSTVG
jgi:hypothetical protein